MNHSKHSGQDRLSDSAQGGRAAIPWQPESRSTMSLARLAAEEAFAPRIPAPAADRNDIPTTHGSAWPTTRTAPTYPAIQARQPRVFRLAAPVATDAPPQTLVVSERATPPVRKSSPDKRPGPVSVVYSRRPEPGVENASATPTVPAASSPARQSLDSAAPADGLIAQGPALEPVSVTYAEVMTKLAELKAVILEIEVARSFTFGLRKR